MLCRSVQRLVNLRDFRQLRGLPESWKRAIHEQAVCTAADGLSAEDVEATLAEMEAQMDAAGNVQPEDQLLLRTAVVGAPNAGKSTLTNALVGSKVSAVSAKTNTTRESRLGAFTEGCAQVVLLDTPGVVASRHFKDTQHQRRVQSAWRTACDADLLLFLVDAHRQLARADPRVESVVADYGERVAQASRMAEEAQQQRKQEQQASSGDGDPQGVGWESTAAAPAGDGGVDSGEAHGQGADVQEQARQAQHAGRQRQQRDAAGGERWPPAVLVLNKVDAVPRPDRGRLLGLAQRFCDLAPFEDVFYISALHGRGLEELRQYLLDHTAPGEWTLPDAQATTDSSMSELALEVVREKLYQRLYAELPYRLELVPVSFQELRDGSLRIEQDVVAPTVGARKIVVGVRGAVVGTVTQEARRELAAIWGRMVHLILNVKTA